jgi:hypothetical protein
MDRFPTQQSFDRRGPAVGAPADGLTQGMVYTAVIRSVPTSDGLVQVTVPSLHLTSAFLAHIQPGTPCKVGETCLVSLDENKLPWVTTGLWKALSLLTLETEVATLEAHLATAEAHLVTAEGKIATLEAHLATAEAKLADSGWKEPALLNSWANAGGVRKEANCAYRLIGKRLVLRGLLVTGVSGAAMFTLPEGFRPSTRVELISAIAAGGSVYAHILVETNGNVVPFFSAGGEGISLDGIDFPLD